MKRLTWLAIMLGSGVLFGGIGFTRTGLDTACLGFGANGALSGVDFCFIFDCNNPILPLCGDQASADDNLLVDCPGGNPLAGGGGDQNP